MSNTMDGVLKCVDTLEENPLECIRTNINGTMNVVNLGLMLDARVVFTSTDKAVMPINIYGQSKAVAEKIVLNASERNVVLRYGNVLGSRASILPGLIKSLRENRKAFITHQSMTRFWMPIETVVNFVYATAISTMTSGLIVPSEIKSSSVVDFIDVVSEIIGVHNYVLDEIGVRAGEKFHEVLTTEFEMGGLKSTDQENMLMTRSELRDMLTPIIGAMK